MENNSTQSPAVPSVGLAGDAGSPLALRLADCISYELGVELNAARIQRELDASLGVLAVRWAQIIADDDRVIANPEAERRAGVLEINRLRTVNSVRREMLAMLNTTLANKKDDTDARSQ